MKGIVLEAVTVSDLMERIRQEVTSSIELAGVDMLITTSEAARIIDCSEETIRNYNVSGRLKTMNPGSHQKWSLRQVINIRRSKQ